MRGSTGKVPSSTDLYEVPQNKLRFSQGDRLKAIRVTDHSLETNPADPFGGNRAGRKIRPITSQGMELNAFTISNETARAIPPLPQSVSKEGEFLRLSLL